MKSLDPNNHRIRAAERFDPCFLESGVAHPAAAIRTREVETGLCLDQHVQAHEQAKRVLSPLIIDNRFADDERPAFWQRGMGLSNQPAFLLQTPVVQDVTHNDYIRGRQRVLEKVAWIKAEPLSQSERLDIFLKDRADDRQVEVAANEV